MGTEAGAVWGEGCPVTRQQGGWGCLLPPQHQPPPPAAAAALVTGEVSIPVTQLPRSATGHHGELCSSLSTSPDPRC